MDPRTELLDLLAKHAYQYRPEDPFTLASGARSDEYLDCKLALSQPAAMVALGKAFLSQLQRRIVAIGGLTMGSDPIAMSTCMASDCTDQLVRWFTVRKEPKVHGQMKLIEGDVASGEDVAVVDDVVTSGNSTIKAIEACRDAGLNVVQVVVLVDRQQSNGMRTIQEFVGPNVHVSAVFTKAEIQKRWQERNPTRLSLVKEA